MCVIDSNPLPPAQCLLYEDQMDAETLEVFSRLAKFRAWTHFQRPSSTVLSLSTKMLSKVLVLLALTALSANAALVKLDNAQDYNRFGKYFISSNCSYFENYDDFEAATCVQDHLSPTPGDFENAKGIWMPCHNTNLTSCEIMYYGFDLARPRTVTVGAKIIGGGTVNAAYASRILEVEDPNAKPWKTTEVAGLNFKQDPDDVNNGEYLDYRSVNIRSGLFAFVFKFTIDIPDDTSFAFVDLLSFEMEDDENKFPPPPPAPVEDDQPHYAIESEAEAKASGLWSEITCAHVEQVNDFWVFGCEQPEQVKDAFDRTNLGLWAPCAFESCDFIFDSRTKAQRPAKITAEGVFGAGAMVAVARKKSGLGRQYQVLVEEAVQVTKSVWEYSIPKDCTYDYFKLTISRAMGPVAIDKISVAMLDEGQGQCSGDPEPVNPTTLPPVPTTPHSTSTGIPEPSTENGESSASSAVLAGVLLLACIVAGQVV